MVAAGLAVRHPREASSKPPSVHPQPLAAEPLDACLLAPVQRLLSHLMPRELPAVPPTPSAAAAAPLSSAPPPPAPSPERKPPPAAPSTERKPPKPASPLRVVASTPPPPRSPLSKEGGSARLLSCSLPQDIPLKPRKHPLTPQLGSHPDPLSLEDEDDDLESYLYFSDDECEGAAGEEGRSSSAVEPERGDGQDEADSDLDDEDGADGGAPSAPADEASEMLFAFEERPRPPTPTLNSAGPATPIHPAIPPKPRPHAAEFE